MFNPGRIFYQTCYSRRTGSRWRQGEEAYSAKIARSCATIIFFTCLLSSVGASSDRCQRSEQSDRGGSVLGQISQDETQAYNSGGPKEAMRASIPSTDAKVEPACGLDSVSAVWSKNCIQRCPSFEGKLQSPGKYTTSFDVPKGLCSRGGENSQITDAYDTNRFWEASREDIWPDINRRPRICSLGDENSQLTNELEGSPTSSCVLDDRGRSIETDQSRTTGSIPVDADCLSRASDSDDTRPIGSDERANIGDDGFSYLKQLKRSISKGFHAPATAVSGSSSRTSCLDPSGRTGTTEVKRLPLRCTQRWTESAKLKTW